MAMSRFIVESSNRLGGHYKEMAFTQNVYRVQMWIAVFNF